MTLVELISLLYRSLHRFIPGARAGTADFLRDRGWRQRLSACLVDHWLGNLRPASWYDVARSHRADIRRQLIFTMEATL